MFGGVGPSYYDLCGFQGRRGKGNNQRYENLIALGLRDYKGFVMNADMAFEESQIDKAAKALQARGCSPEFARECAEREMK